MKFSTLFEKYWGQAITGFIGGLTVYIILTNWGISDNKITNFFFKTLFAFFTALILILIYTFFVWIGEKYDWDRKRRR